MASPMSATPRPTACGVRQTYPQQPAQVQHLTRGCGRELSSSARRAAPLPPHVAIKHSAVLSAGGPQLLVYANMLARLDLGICQQKLPKLPPLRPQPYHCTCFAAQRSLASRQYRRYNSAMATSVEVMRQAFDAFRVGNVKGITSLCSDGRASNLCSLWPLAVKIVTVSHLYLQTASGLPWGLCCHGEASTRQACLVNSYNECFS